MKKTSKILSVVLAVLMLLGALPFAASAEIPEVKLGELAKVVLPTDEGVTALFKAGESGEYVVISDNGGDDENIDPYISVYDSKGNEIAYDDDNDFYDTYNFYCVFEAEAGKEYTFLLDAYELDIRYNFIVYRCSKIGHQPTADEPYVLIDGDDDGNSQWYTFADADEVEITDENAIASYYNNELANYNSEDGWTPAAFAEGSNKYQCEFFETYFEAGSTVYVETSGKVLNKIELRSDVDTISLKATGVKNDDYTFEIEESGKYTLACGAESDFSVKAYVDGQVCVPVEGADISVLDPEEDFKYFCKFSYGNGTKELSDSFRATPYIALNEVKTAHFPTAEETYFKFAPAESGKYVVLSNNGGDDDNIDPAVLVTNAGGQKIADNDDNVYIEDTYNFYCVFDAVKGQTYTLCLSELYENVCEYDIVIKWYAEIAHQPTVDQPYVTLNRTAAAKYQWYELVDADYAQITNTHAVPAAVEGALSSYNASTGWTPATEPAPLDATKDYCEFFEIYLEAGSKLRIDTDGTALEEIGIWSELTGKGDEEEATGAADDTYALVAPVTGTYVLYGYSEPGMTVKAYVDGILYTPVSGATKSSYSTQTPGTYACKVSYDGGRTEYSNAFVVAEPEPVCDHMCHQDGFFGFLWKIVNFFCKLFGINPVCECGKAHW